MFSKPAAGQVIAKLSIELPDAVPGLKVPVSVDLDAITFLADTSLSLVKMDGSDTPVPMQIENGQHRQLHWLVTPEAGVQNYHFQLVQAKPQKSQKLVQTTTSDGLLTVEAGDQKLIGYQFGTLYPPAGVDSVFQRSGFIHPLWSPHGQVLTRIQPADHYHHYGLWNPWTHTLFEADTVDFWNLAKHEGTVRFANFVSTTDGPVFSEFQALHEHVVFKEDGAEKVALHELQTVRVYQPESDYYLADMTIELNCASGSPLRLLEYRYGGLGWRATEQWHKDNSDVLTSEGHTRADTDGSLARWCLVQGEVDDDYAGAVLMSYPTNYNHPEPLRVWPANMEERGEVFVNFSPTKNMDWLLEPGHRYVLKYRLIVFNGRLSAEKAESGWQSFANPPKVTIEN